MNKKYCRYITYELQKQNADSMEVQMLSRPISFINFRIHVRLEKTPHYKPQPMRKCLSSIGKFTTSCKKILPRLRPAQNHCVLSLVCVLVSANKYRVKYNNE